MSTRRDINLTPEQDQLWRQIRALYRYAPITNRDFAVVAPNLASTLRRRDPGNALETFYEVLDAQESTRNLQALIALLGMGPQRAETVMDRKTAFNNDVDPRTVARWADAAAKDIVVYVTGRFERVGATVFVSMRQNGEKLLIDFSFLTNALMEDIVITDMASDLWIEQHHVYDRNARYTATLMKAIDYSVDEYTIEDDQDAVQVYWPGPIAPHFMISPNNVNITWGVSMRTQSMMIFRGTKTDD